MFSISISVSESGLGNLSNCAAEIASARLGLRASSAVRLVVRAFTSFALRSVSVTETFVGDVRGSSAANAAADAVIATLLTRHNGARSKGYTPDCAHPDQLRTVVHVFPLQILLQETGKVLSLDTTGVTKYETLHHETLFRTWKFCLCGIKSHQILHAGLV